MAEFTETSGVKGGLDWYWKVYESHVWGTLSYEAQRIVPELALRVRHRQDFGEMPDDLVAEILGWTDSNNGRRRSRCQGVMRQLIDAGIVAKMNGKRGAYYVRNPLSERDTSDVQLTQCDTPEVSDHTSDVSSDTRDVRFDTSDVSLIRKQEYSRDESRVSQEGARDFASELIEAWGGHVKSGPSRVRRIAGEHAISISNRHGSVDEAWAWLIDRARVFWKAERKARRNDRSFCRRLETWLADEGYDAPMPGDAARAEADTVEAWWGGLTDGDRQACEAWAWDHHAGPLRHKPPGRDRTECIAKLAHGAIVLGKGHTPPCLPHENARRSDGRLNTETRETQREAV